ncbi:tripartite tricarboxylate transporter substrate binding protein [Ramlibacter sp. G-1-2-2]|uniref:Tripartite tricarboxylate transporter substrate binding protein n=1 Tax=Ramlibacter agri TaxID=2728837 RepID=A0A848HB74_9BURK|nr:tripartite tricarboxylate transporter substrate binding protein [Ramlibacter agri]NML46740.1 tripartite tricarboxylate transporter substrate binding protein [Ramlibacter agri]
MKQLHIARRALLGCALALALPAIAQTYPSKPIRFVIPYPAGGTSDVVGRLLANGLAERLKQPVVVDNRAGAATVIGTDIVAKSPADGYTLLLASPGLAINAAMKKGILPYDTEADLEAVCTVAELQMVIYASASSGFRTLGELLAAAKARPGAISFGTAGEGSTGHLGMKLVEQAAGVKLTHIPFQGSAPSMNAPLGGHVNLIVDTSFLGAPNVASGKIKGLAALASRRSPLLPEVPTATELGVKVDASAWYAIFTRRGTPPAVVEKINAALRSVLQDPKSREILDKSGFSVIADSPAQSQAFFQGELAKMAAAVRESN